MNEKFEELRKANDLKVADWFEPSNIPSYVYVPYDWRYEFEIIGETEKAVKLMIYTEILGSERDYNLIIWVPKACFESNKAYDKAFMEKEARREEALAKGAERYEKLLAFAKENGVKGVRKFMRAETILNKVREAGLVYNY